MDAPQHTLGLPKTKSKTLQTRHSFLKQKQVNSQTLRSTAFHSLGWFASTFVVKKQFGSFIKEMASKSSYQALQMPQHVTPPSTNPPRNSTIGKTSAAQPIMDTGCSNNVHGIALLLSRLLTEASCGEVCESHMADHQFHVMVSYFL